MIMINSPSLESDSDKHNRSSNKNDLLINSTSENNFNDINNNNSIDCNNTMKQNILSLNDTTLLTTTTTTTVEVKVKTTKTSSRKRKLNDINNDKINKQQIVTKKKKKQSGTKIDDDDDSLNDRKKLNSKTVDQSSITDESSFGSCEPGTNVVLQGIVWNETDKGVLVVNITWRGKTYVGALLNTTEQNWAPPRYKNDIRSIKPNHNRDHPLTSTPSSQDSTERILRNGKRRGSSITVTPSPTTKTKSFKIPEAPVSKIEDELNSPNEDKTLNRNGNIDDETGDNYSSRSVSPITSGTSTTSSSSPPLHQTPIDLSNSKTNDNTLIPYHFPNDILFPSSANSSDYFSSLHGSTNPFSLPSFNKLSSTSSYLPIPFLTTSPYPSISSLSKSSH